MSYNIDVDAVKIEINNLKKDVEKWKSGGSITFKEFRKEMSAKYSYLHNSSITLFDKSIEGELESPESMHRLNHMLELMRQMQMGRRSKGDVEAQFGKEMADEYINPIIDKLDNTKI